MAALLVDRYELLRRVGSGGMATVWLAMDRRLEREVAVKVLSDTLAGDERFRERFEREARRVASLSHPNIVIVHDFGVDGDTLFIVMELVRGMPLRRVLLSAPLASEPTHQLALGILAGLGHAHDSGLLHRDIKPGNILLTESGSAKLADFGIAKSIDETIGLTDSGAILGSVSYASPEQLAGNPLTPASDLYSFSCVLYECLAGQPPFVADNLVTLVARQQNEAPRPLRDVAPLAPRELANAVMHGLIKDPERRFATAEEMEEALTSPLGRAGRSKEQSKPPVAPLPARLSPDKIPTDHSPDSSLAKTPGSIRPWWRRRVTKIATALFLAAALVSAIALIFVQGTNTIAPKLLSPAGRGYTPRLLDAKCPPSVAGSRVSCRYLIVPQDRSRPKGRQIRLLVIQEAARIPNPASDPVLDLGSFPFQGSVGFVFQGLLGKAQFYSNYIALARRGGAGSTPELSCPEVISATKSALALPGSDPQQTSIQVSAYAACRKRLIGLGINPNDYGDDARVDDVRDLLSALHLTRVNILAGEEESRVAYDLMRVEPAAIRSVTLANPLSPSVDELMNTTSGLISALDELQVQCNRSPGCAKAFPNLKQKAMADFTEFQAHPVTVDVAARGSNKSIPVVIDGDQLDSVVDIAFGNGFSALIASQVYNPNVKIIADGIVTTDEFGGTQSDTPIVGAAQSEYCKDQYPDDTNIDRLNDQAADQSDPTFAGADNDALDADECRAWDVAPDNANDFVPISSTIPTFIVTGGIISGSDYPAWVTQITSGLTHSVVLTFPTLADGTSSGTSGEAPAPSCSSPLELEFLRHPLRSIAVKSCEAQSPAIDFSQ
jgi:serine/threonine protein kinase